MYFLFWLLTIADKLSTLFQVTAILTTVALGGISLVVICTGSYEKYENPRADPELRRVEPWYTSCVKATKILRIVAPICMLLFIATPSKKDAVLIIAGGAVGTFIQNDSSARAIPADVTRFLHAQINQYAREAELGSILEPAGVKAQRDSLSNLTKEQLVEGLIKKE